ncbi:hypothetical protein C0993_005640 [Termitomyces sp. T159_Od127]|nr:hypothetical protein C0993_005640 [Termitomyces sp. T159_Od127]
MKHINNLAKGHPNNEQIASWYKVAWDQWQLMEIQQELCWMHPTHHPTPMVSLQHLAPLHSVLAPRPLLPGISMDVNATQQHHSTPLLCQQCKKPGHFEQHCLLVCYLFTAEQEELHLQLLAAKDAAGALSPNEGGACATLLSQEEDFQSSNG